MHLVLIRHGTAAGAAERCVGHTDIALSPQGENEIRQLVANCGWHHGTTDTSGSHIFSSDLLRASSSARIIAGATNGVVALDARLREMNFGVWDGCSWSDIEHHDASRLHTWMEQWSEHATPGGESARDLLARAKDWITSTIACSGPDQQLVVVSHAGWIRAAVAYLLGYDLARMFEIPADHARATVIEVNPSGNSLVKSNADYY